MIGFSDRIDLWVIKIKKPMILCARRTSRLSGRGENMQKALYFIDCMIIKHGRHIFGEIYEVRKGLWFVFLIVPFGC